MGGADLQLHPFLDSEAALRPILKDDGLRGPRSPCAGYGEDSLLLSLLAVYLQLFGCPTGSTVILSPNMPYGHTTIHSYVILKLRTLSASPQLTKHPATPSSNKSTCQYLPSMTSCTHNTVLRTTNISRRNKRFLPPPQNPDPAELLFGVFFSWWIIRPGGEAGRLTPSGLKVKNVWRHTSTLSQAFYGMMFTYEQEEIYLPNTKRYGGRTERFNNALTIVSKAKF